MKPIKTYEYNADNFIRGRLTASSLSQVRKFLRTMLGLSAYLKARKRIIITEINE
jgi:hypothetical protein